MGSCRVDVKWFHVCKAISKDRICGCFMEDELLKQCGNSLTCQTSWEQLQDRRRDGPHNEQMWTYYEQWFHDIPMSEWPVLGCGAKVACRKPEGELCQIRF